MSLCHKFLFFNTYISTTKLCEPLIFQTRIVLYNRRHSLKYPRSTTLAFKDKEIKKSQFVTKTQFLYRKKLTVITVGPTTDSLLKKHRNLLCINFQNWVDSTTFCSHVHPNLQWT